MATPGGSNKRSSSPNEGAAKVKGSPGKVRANTPGGSKNRSSSPNSGAASIKGGSRGSRG